MSSVCFYQREYISFSGCRMRAFVFDYFHLFPLTRKNEKNSGIVWARILIESESKCVMRSFCYYFILYFFFSLRSLSLYQSPYVWFCLRNKFLFAYIMPMIHTRTRAVFVLCDIHVSMAFNLFDEWQRQAQIDPNQYVRYTPIYQMFWMFQTK